MRFDGVPEAAQPLSKSSALLTIDVQADFTLPGAPAEIPGTLEAVAHMAEVVRAFRRASRPIVHVVRLYEPDGSNGELSRRARLAEEPSIVAPGTPGADVIADLMPTADIDPDPSILLGGGFQEIAQNEWLMFKPRWGAFFETPLQGHLEHLGVDTIAVCGCNYPNCPRTTVYEGSERDFRVMLVRDAVSGLYERGEDEMRDIGVALVESGDAPAWLSS